MLWQIALYILLVVILFVIGFRLLRNYEKKTHQAQISRKLEPYLFVMPTFLLLLLAFGYPLINSIWMAFQNYKLTQPGKIYFNNFANFNNLFSDRDIGLIMRNSFVYVIASVGMQFLLGMTLALALKKKFRGRGAYQAIVFLPWAFSAFVVGLMFRWSFNGEYGVVNDLLIKLGLASEKIAWLGTPGLSLLVVIFAMIWMGVPFFAIMYLAALQSIPEDVYEAADIDGCGAIRRFFAITFPYIKPTVIMTLLLRTIWVFNSFDLIVVITGGGPANHSQTLPSYMYTRAFSGYDFGLASALGVVLMVILAVYAVIFLKVTKYNKAGDF
ncbi:MAG: carbohydrate ABC transporter permease [Christensenellales bacterium]|jgi:multiple sugar transport system permease protein